MRGKTNISRYHSNPNLIINWNLINPINQREHTMQYFSIIGTMMYSDSACTIEVGNQTKNVIFASIQDNDNFKLDGFNYYCKAEDVKYGWVCLTGNISIDGWYLNNEEYTACLELSDNGTILYSLNGVLRDLQQTLEIASYNEFAGKIMTLSILTEEFGLETKTSVVQPEQPNEWTSMIFTPRCQMYWYPAKSIFGIDINTRNVDKLTIKGVKLEFGAEQTLAHLEDGKWVINEMPLYAEELAKCQRYCTVLNTLGSNYGCVGNGIAESSTTCTITVPTPTSLTSGLQYIKQQPRISFSGKWSLYDGSSTKPVTNMAQSDRWNDNTTTIVVTSSGLTTGKFYQLRAENDSNARIIISADI